MDRHLAQSVIAGAAFLPWVVEVVLQLRLQALYLVALPREARAVLPPHPRRPPLAFLAGARFHLALWRSFRRDEPDDAPRVVTLKRRMRASLRRELVWATSGLSAACVLLARGWRPF